MQPLYSFVESALRVMWAPLGRFLAYVLRGRNQIQEGTNDFVADREKMTKCTLAGNAR